MKWKIETVLQTSPSSLYVGVVLCITSTYIESSIRQCYNFCSQSYFNKFKGREIAYQKHPDIYHFCCSFPNFQVSLQYYFPSFLRAVFSNSFSVGLLGRNFLSFLSAERVTCLPSCLFLKDIFVAYRILDLRILFFPFST